MDHKRIEEMKGTKDSSDSQGKGGGNRASKSLIYELFVLGELLDGPRHGYQLREILSRLLGPYRQISWGMLYPLIRQLEREGLLTYEDMAEEQKRRQAPSRERKPYVITATGRERFSTLMLEQGDYSSDYRELFITKLNNFDYLSPKQQLTILGQYRGYLQAEDLYLSRGQQHVLTSPHLPDPHRTHILQVISFRWSGIRGEMRWIEDRIRHLEKEADKTL